MANDGDYGRRRVADGNILLTEIQTQDARAAAQEDVWRLRKRFNHPQIPRDELQDWQAFNEQGTYDDITQV
jgi:hypothetical protein